MVKTINHIESGCLKQIIKNASLPKPPTDGAFQPTCVFLLLFGLKDPHILAIQKADTEGYPWANQVALPGGHVEHKDASSVDTAYRELEEELKITPDQVELVGSLGHFQTINNKDIEVFIGLWNGEGPVRFDTNEIARVLEIPLQQLVKTHITAGFHGRRPPTDDLEYPLTDVVIWGVTARILHQFMEILYPYIDKNKYLT